MEAAVREDRIAKPRFGIPRVVEGRVDREGRLRRIRGRSAEAGDPSGSLERELNVHVSVREGVVCEPGKDESPSERLRGSRRKRELVLRPVGLARVDHVVRLGGEHASRVRKRPRMLRRGRRERTRDQQDESRFHDPTLGRNQTVITKQASCEEGDTCTRRLRRPCRSSTQKIPRSSEGVTIQPKASCTLYDPTGTFVVCTTRPSCKDSTRSVPSSPLVTYACEPEKVTC